MKEPGGCSTISEQENGNCNELSSTDGLEIEPSFPRLGFPIPAPVRHSLQANQVVFPGKWVIISHHLPGAQTLQALMLWRYLHSIPIPSGCDFPVPSPVQDLSPMETSLRRSWKWLPRLPGFQEFQAGAKRNCLRRCKSYKCKNLPPFPAPPRTPPLSQVCDRVASGNWGFLLWFLQQKP